MKGPATREMIPWIDIETTGGDGSKRGDLLPVMSRKSAPSKSSFARIWLIFDGQYDTAKNAVVGAMIAFAPRRFLLLRQLTLLLVFCLVTSPLCRHLFIKYVRFLVFPNISPRPRNNVTACLFFFMRPIYWDAMGPGVDSHFSQRIIHHIHDRYYCTGVKISASLVPIKLVNKPT